MKVRHKVMTVAGCAVMLLTGLSTGAASAADESGCSTPVLKSESVRLSDPGRWAYTYWVSWCVEGGKITKITPHVTHEEDGSTCVWVGSAEESQTPVQDGRGAWNAFNMSEFSCKKGDGTDGSVNPWGVITVRPDGVSDIPSKGVGDVIVE